MFLRNCFPLLLSDLGEIKYKRSEQNAFSAFVSFVKIDAGKAKLCLTYKHK